MYLEQCVSWKTHIIKKAQQIQQRLKTYWLLFYKVILKTHLNLSSKNGTHLEKSNLKIIQRVQNKILKILVISARYVSNWFVRNTKEVTLLQQS